MLANDNYSTNGSNVSIRKSALINLAAVAVRLTRDQLQDSERKIANEIEAGCRAKREGDYHQEYTNNCHAHTEAERIIQYAKDYKEAIDAYFYLRMIDTEGENRELHMVD